MDRRRSRRFCLDCCGGSIPESFGTAYSLDFCNLAMRPNSQPPGRQRGQLPIQILISVALDSCGGNSPAANADRQTTSWRLAMFLSATPSAHDIKSRIARRPTPANSLLKPLSRFVGNLKCGHTPVNGWEYVPRLSVGGANV